MARKSRIIEELMEEKVPYGGAIATRYEVYQDLLDLGYDWKHADYMSMSLRPATREEIETLPSFEDLMEMLEARGLRNPDDLCPVGMEVQSFLFPKSRYTKKQAIAWLRRHGHRTAIDPSKRFWRARQAEPAEFEFMRTITLPGGFGIKAVVGCPK